jgi:hypothetical protein
MSIIYMDLVGFVEANSDIHQKSSDHTNLNSNNVKYVFDADILGLFVRPRTYLHYGIDKLNPKRSFSFDWGINLWDDERDEDPRVQHALIMGEHLLSGNLPGSDGHIYFTTWHNKEISEGFRHISTTLAQGSAQILNDLRTEADRYIQAVSCVSTSKIETEFKTYEAPVPILDGIDAMSGITKILAEDDLIEPLEQLERLLFLLKKNGRVINDIADVGVSLIDELKEDAKQWAGLLKDIGRIKKSLRDDALSLAYLRAATKNANPPGSILFVTGDNELFKMYRNWYYKNDIREPFFLRRFAQYNPTLNAESPNSDIYKNPDTNGFFDSIKNMVHATLISHAHRWDSEKLNIVEESNIPSNNRSQWLAWWYSEHPEIQRVLDTAVDTDQIQAERILTTKDELRWAQKQASGVFSKLSSNRLSKKLRKRLRSADKAAFIRALEEYLKNRIRSIDSMALKYINEADIRHISLLYGQRSGPHRTPDTILYRIGSETLADIVKKLDDKGKSKDPLKLDFGSFIDIRAYAAAIALSTRSWRDAEIYARSARNMIPSDENRSQSCELHFLECVAKRYSLAEQLGEMNSIGKEFSRNSLSAFDRLLKKIKSISDEIGLRYQSESAAIRIFKSEIMLINEIFSTLSAELTLAANDLTTCINKIESRCTDSQVVIGQVMHNFASCFILSVLLKLRIPSSEYYRYQNTQIQLVQNYFLAETVWQQPQSDFLSMEQKFFLFLTEDSHYDATPIIDLLKLIPGEENNMEMDIKLSIVIFDVIHKFDVLELKRVASDIIFDTRM